MAPDDPVLAQMLASGEFETILRIGSGRLSTATTGAYLLERYPELSAAGAEYLSQLADQVRQAGRGIADLTHDEIIPYRELPRVPSRGIIGAEPGDIVTLAKTSMPGGGPRGKDIAVDSATVHGAPPTADQLLSDVRAGAAAVAAHYEDLDAIEGAELDELIEEIVGIMVIE